MKFDLFVLKALEKKGYVLDEVIKLSDEEIDELHLSDKIITSIKEYKQRGGLTSKEVAEELARIMELDEETHISTEAIVEYSEVPKPEVLEIDISEMNSAEAVEFTQSVKDEFVKTETTEEDVVRTIASPEDIKIIKEVLQKKELRSFATYTKLLKSEVPAAVLDAVESTTLNSLIDERIAEVKADSTK